MLLLRSARTTTHTYDEVLNYVVHHAARYDITPVAHRFFAENPREQRDIRYDFGSLVPPDGDTYFEFDLPPYVRLGQRLLLDQSGVRTAGVLVQRYAREDLADFEYLVCALPYTARRRARVRATQFVSATFLLELLGNEPTVFSPVMRHDYLLGEDGLPVVPNFVQRFTNAVMTDHNDKEVFLPYRSLHFPVFEAVRLLREGSGSKEAKVTVAKACEAPQTFPIPLPYPLSGGSVRFMKLSYHVLEPLAMLSQHQVAILVHLLL